MAGSPPPFPLRTVCASLFFFREKTYFSPFIPWSTIIASNVRSDLDSKLQPLRSNRSAALESPRYPLVLDVPVARIDVVLRVLLEDSSRFGCVRFFFHC